MPTGIQPKTIARARALRRAMTGGEQKLWSELKDFRRHYGIHVRKQAPIGPFIADFVCRSEKLIVELDGSRHAESPADERRTQWLTAQGYFVLRFWNDEVAFERGAVLETMLAALEGRLFPPHPTQASAQLRFAVPSYPSPRRGEESTATLANGS